VDVSVFLLHLEEPPMDQSPTVFLLDARDQDKTTYVCLKLRDGAAVCGPYTDDQARRRAASYYHDMAAARSVTTTLEPEIPEGDPDNDWIVKASHPDGRRAVIGPFRVPDTVEDVLAELADGIGSEVERWHLELERLGVAA
jgi:hypothetical protein